MRKRRIVISASLDNETLDILEKVADGNVSAGIRQLAAQWDARQDASRPEGERKYAPLDEHGNQALFEVPLIGGSKPLIDPTDELSDVEI